MRSIHYSWLAIALIACGDDGVHHLDDGGIDASDIDASEPPGDPVTVTVTNGGLPAADVKVYFLNADNSVVSNTTTGSDGTASAVMDAGGSVTVIEPDPVGGRAFTGGTLDTYTGVKPGDNLFIDVGFDDVQTSATFNVTIPADPNPAITNYELFSNCGEADLTPPPPPPALSNQPVSITLSGCGATADWFITGTGIGSGSASITDFLFAPDVAIADGVDVTLDEATNTYAAFENRNVTLTNLEAIATDASTQVSFFTAKGDLQFDINGTDAVPDGGTAISSFQAPAPTTGLSAEIDAQVSFDGSVSDVFQVGVAWGPVPAADVDLDFSTVQLTHITDFPTFDTATQTMNWGVGATGVDGDAVFTQVSADRADANGDTFWNWQIVGTNTAGGKLQFPTLPTDVFDFTIADTDNPTFDFLEVVKVPGGYDTVRPFAFSQTFNPHDISATGAAIFEIVFSRATAFDMTKAAPSSLSPIRAVKHNRKNLLHKQLQPKKPAIRVTHKSK